MVATSATDSSNLGQNVTLYDVILPSYPDTVVRNLNFTGEWIEYQFPTTANINSYTFNSTAFPAEWYILGYSLDRNVWVVMHHVSFVAIERQTSRYNNFTWRVRTNLITNRIRFHTSVAVLNFVEINKLLFYDEVGDHKTFLIPFCTQTNSMTHTGSLNFSQINDFSINTFPKLNTEFFAVGVNTLRIESGMGNLLFN
jgi:hypothetical protein